MPRLSYIVQGSILASDLEIETVFRAIRCRASSANTVRSQSQLQASLQEVAPPS